MQPVIYQITFRDGSAYVGSTTRFSERRRSHLRSPFNKKHVTNQRLTEKLRQDGICCYFAVASALRKEDMHLVERDVIATFNPNLNDVREPTPVHFHAGPTKTSVAFGPYRSMSVAAKALGTNRTRLRRSGTYEKFLEDRARQARERARARGLAKLRRESKMGPPDPRKRPNLISNGEGWHFVSAVRQVGEKTVERRRKNGWTRWDSLTKPPQEPVRIASVCTRYGVTYPTFWARRNQGWTVMQALGLKPPPPNEEKKVKKRTLTVQGQTKTLDAWAKQLGVSTQVLHQRIHNKWTPEEIVGLALRPQAQARQLREQTPKKPPRKRATYTYKGVTGGVSDLCRAFGVPDSVVRSRLASGYDIEYAIEMPGPAERRAARKEALARIFQPQGPLKTATRPPTLPTPENPQPPAEPPVNPRNTLHV